MAEADKNQEQPEGGKSNKKLIIIIAIVVLLSIGLSIGATIFFLGGSGESEQAAATPAEPAEPVKQPAVYLELKPAFVITYNVEGRQRYMQAHVSVMSRSQSVLSTLELHMPLIRNRVIMMFSGQDFNQLQSHEGKEQLREKTLGLINGILEKEGNGELIEQVLFTNFVMQ